MEVESKYAVPDLETFEQLLSLTHLGEFWLRPAGEKLVTDHYYDTAERAVFRGGYALRLRERPNGAEWLATLKGLAGEGAADGQHEREEFEAAVPPGAPLAAWPAGEARERALALVGAAPLAELFSLTQTRHKRILVSGEGDHAREAAELSLDRVIMPGAPADQPIYELEIELRPDGTRADLKAAAEALVGYQLTPEPLSKFERALALVDGVPVQALAAPLAEAAPESEPHASGHKAAKAARPKTPGVRADESMAQTGRKVLRFHFDRMIGKEDDVRAGDDIEAVHDMRVATRRQRAAFALFEAYFKAKPVRRFGGELKQVAHLLGAVRDLDVQLKAVADYAAGLAAAEPLQPLIQAWSAERDTARAALLACLDSRDYRRFKKDYQKFLERQDKVPAPSADELPTPNLVRQVLPGQLWDYFGEVRAFETVMARASVPTLHRLRIASKSLRYAQEFFREVLEPAGGSKKDGIGYTIEAVVSLQDHIGELHDADVTIARLDAFLDQSTQHKGDVPAATLTAVRRYRRAKQGELKKLHVAAARPWAAVIGPNFRKILARACARL